MCEDAYEDEKEVSVYLTLELQEIAKVVTCEISSGN